MDALPLEEPLADVLGTTLADVPADTLTELLVEGLVNTLGDGWTDTLLKVNILDELPKPALAADPAPDPEVLATGAATASDEDNPKTAKTSAIRRTRGRRI